MDGSRLSDRFWFGKNWLKFAAIITKSRIETAEQSLQSLFQIRDWMGKRVLDIGCGSGLFSLAACRMGARVFSFDYDGDAVACTREIKNKFAPDSADWEIVQGSVLDQPFLKSLGQFDVVYSWGVLHHTGSMWQALENAHSLVLPGGLLGLAIYNYQGSASRRWMALKKLYNQSSRPIQLALVLAVGAFFEGRSAFIRLFKLENPLPFKDWSEKEKLRGMSVWYDLVDWTGGYPFETAKPEEIFDYYRQRRFVLEKLKTCAGGHGCNEFVFRKAAER